MAQFLYITEVFCPWCYGFSPIISSIKDKYNLPFHVICGALIEEPTSLAKRLERTPNIEAFIERMYSITKVRISENYVKMLRSEQNTEIMLDSQKGGLLFYTLKHFADDKSLEIMKDLQNILYNQGRDVLSEAVLWEISQKYSFDFDEIQKFMRSDEAIDKAYEETELSFDIMNDVVLYPTLYYVDDLGQRYFISRGFTEYENCVLVIDEVLQAVKKGIAPEKFERIRENLLFVHNKSNSHNAHNDGDDLAITKNESAPFACSLTGKCE